MRERIAENKLRRVMSTRNIEDLTKLLVASNGNCELAFNTYFEDWREDECERVSKGDLLEILKGEKTEVALDIPF